MSKRRKGKRGVRRRDQRAEALRVLFVSEVARKKREADAALVYTFATSDPPAGQCSDCEKPALKLVDATPPLDLDDFPVGRGICLGCASMLETAAREERAAHEGKAEAEGEGV